MLTSAAITPEVSDLLARWISSRISAYRDSVNNPNPSAQAYNLRVIELMDIANYQWYTAS